MSDQEAIASGVFGSLEEVIGVEVLVDLADKCVISALKRSLLVSTHKYIMNYHMPLDSYGY